MKAFFDTIRPLFGGRMTHAEVEGCETILAISHGLPRTHRAYILATAFHETGGTMQPNVENMNYTTAARIRAVWPSRFVSEADAAPYVKSPRALANKVYNGRLGNRLGTDDGWIYRGHGLVHITGRENFARAGKKLGVDLLKDPRRALNPTVAARILVLGMDEGWFTGKKLSDFTRFEDMRRVVNGTDQAERIAGYARTFDKALAAVAPSTPPIIGGTGGADEPPPIRNPLAALLAALASLLARIFGGRK